MLGGNSERKIVGERKRKKKGKKKEARRVIWQMVKRAT
jgi:hypothetical protein